MSIVELHSCIASPRVKQTYFSPELFAFLRQLKRHNNREWFQANKNRYETSVRDPFLKFIEDFRPRLHNISPHFIAEPKASGGSLLRIYKDLRFRPDAPPYQTMAAARFPHQAWKQLRTPGFYLHLEPHRSFLGSGLWHPDPETRARIREAIIATPSQWKKVTSGKRFNALCELSGDSMKRMPPGCDINHPFADDLKRKDFITVTNFTENQVVAPDFLNAATRACQATAPFMEFLTKALGLPWSGEDRPLVRDPVGVDSLQLG
jgi:uncharacterized protein (TIGR02453 family)